MIKKFLDVVEIRTKLASFFPYTIGVLFSIYTFNRIDFLNMILFFIAMLMFDMATTAINNLADFKKAKDMDYRHQTNVIGTAQLNEKKVQYLIVGLISVSSFLGLILTYRTSLLLLAMGGICFLIGILYTAGPVPLSRMPLGEIFSGVTMGFGIFFITTYLNVYDLDVLTLNLSNDTFTVTGNIPVLFKMIWASIPLVFTIANIMLANNLCDLDQDIKNARYTLPYYIGKKNAITLFQVLMYGCYISILLGIIFSVYHWSMVVVLLSYPKIKKNVEQFALVQDKTKTFIFSIRNLVIFNTFQIIGLSMSILFALF